MYKSLLVTALILTSLAACSDQRGSLGTASAKTEFGDYGYSDVYRYYGGPSAATQESDAQRQADRHVTQQR
jgi:hypothetical protein